MEWEELDLLFAILEIRAFQSHCKTSSVIMKKKKKSLTVYSIAVHLAEKVEYFGSYL